MAKHTDFIEQVLRLFILLGFGSLFYQALSQKDLLQLIHPQFTVNAQLGLALLVFLCAIQLFRVCTARNAEGCGCGHSFNSFFYYVFIATLFLCLLVPTKPLGSLTAQQKGLKHLTGTKPGTQNNQFVFNDYEPLLPNGKTADSKQPLPTSVKAAETPQPKTIPVITITDSNHIRYMTAFYEYTEGFLNKEVNIKGFVYRPRNLPPNQFMVTRFEISCCAADGMPSGLVVEWPDAGKFKNDTWVEVQGTITQGAYEGLPMPLLKGKTVSSIKPLDNPYVYAPNRIINPLHQQGTPESIPSSAPDGWGK